jgi:hypothetical protein
MRFSNMLDLFLFQQNKELELMLKEQELKVSPKRHVLSFVCF